MGKITILYGLTIVSLFVCLTLALSLFGLGKAEPPPLPAVEEKKAPLTFDLENIDEEAVFARLPELYVGLDYIATIGTPLYKEITDRAFSSEVLPAGGVFYIEKFEYEPEPGWYKVLVSNGRRNMQRYVKADAIESQVPTYYEKGPSKAMIKKHGIEREIMMSFHIASLKSQMRKARQEPEEIESRVSFSEIIDSMFYTMNDLNSRGIIFPILISLSICSVLATFLVVVSGFKKAYSWEQDATLDNYDSHYGLESGEADPDRFEN
jgi:hypothetical protein